MEITIRFPHFHVTGKGDDLASAMEDLGEAQNLFRHNICQEYVDGKRCGGHALPQFRRSHQGNWPFYEMVCQSCGATFRFGALSGGGLFPKTHQLKKDGGEPLPNFGWARYRSDEHQPEQSDEF